MENVLQDLDLVKKEGFEFGLHLNPQRSEIICSDHAAREFLLCIHCLIAGVIDSEKATFLESPVDDISLITTVLDEKIKLDGNGETLKHLFSNDAIPLLHHSFSIPKLLYNLRTALCAFYCQGSWSTTPS